MEVDTVTERERGVAVDLAATERGAGSEPQARMIAESANSNRVAPMRIPALECGISVNLLSGSKMGAKIVAIRIKSGRRNGDHW